ncbi:2-oxoglutarate dehydrogenase E1 component [Paenibacillus lutrae]|uniref:2-oxoglutarate dehydrogenase E1 component n=1 Tax=Paenibacillus lutrae TaxID=2078573 RepID=A0A7X3K0P7_9BACL|nr:2-oxoglutarate dehydrogenase E1 component [Paenibacillus lutrae]MVP01176.1 2-oxoglutarate dehydrogenase E1 component [Paenibacillus lutrae]
MKNGQEDRRWPWANYYGPNLGYIQEQYEQYQNNPESVEETFRELFARFGAPPAESGTTGSGQQQAQVTDSSNPQVLKKVMAVSKLVWNIRTYGHLAANIDPLGLSTTADTRLLEPATYGLTKEDLIALPSSLVWEEAPSDVANGWEAIERLRKSYSQSIAFEFSHVHEESERDWLNRQAESGASIEPLTSEERIKLLDRLIQAEQFEQFLHRTFVGQKRFSLQGTDVLIPILDQIVHEVVLDGASHILMGMAHRGRLNVLAHILGKPYNKIFKEFHHSPNKDIIPSEGSMGINYGWTGDVKYHLGEQRSIKEGDALEAKLTLANNPSHLEFVGAVVEGFTRAAQDNRENPGYPVQDVSKAATITIHGDAAFPGEGIVAETLNFTKLQGYRNGGTIHIIVNNRVGFTTDSSDSRSTHYASDPAKGYEIPIVHVNADDADACIAAARLACEYRNRFKKDFLIDLVGYRRFGHNENDDPETTQPLMYQKVKNHPTVSVSYAEKLKQEGLIDDQRYQKMVQDVQAKLQEAYDLVKNKDSGNRLANVVVFDKDLKIDTAVPLPQLQEINKALITWPEDFHVYPKLQRILERRGDALNEGGKVDWALAETLAFATILADGKPIRMTGQDVGRGTFAHRHVVLHDSKTGATYSPLHKIPQARASFAIYNSPLSEGSILGFEYGYNVYSPETLVIWEAQYGDFANAAQVIIDQFIAAGRVKWAQKSSLVMLLPHGYEGQGPEHSSARLERYLQSSAENNWTVANLSTAAQYFHILRRQAAITEREEARPLIIMSPKSLIRNARVASPGTQFSEGSFMPIIEQQGLGEQPKKIRRLVLCTGKIAIDLEEALEADKEKDYSWLQIVRVEQLYPFPDKEIAAVMERFTGLKEIIWVQEEPKNMGAWNFMEPRIRAIAPSKADVQYIGLPDRSSPASGFQEVHTFEHNQIIANALKQPE